MKKVNFNQAFCELNGDRILVKGEPFLMKTILVNKLGSVEHGGDIDKTFDCYNLAKKIHDSDGEVDLTDKEIAMIKEILPGLQTILVGQIIKVLI